MEPLWIVEYNINEFLDNIVVKYQLKLEKWILFSLQYHYQNAIRRSNIILQSIAPCMLLGTVIRPSIQWIAHLFRIGPWPNVSGGIVPVLMSIQSTPFSRYKTTMVFMLALEWQRQPLSFLSVEFW